VTHPEYLENMAALLAVVLPLAVGAAVSPTLLALQLVVLTGQTKPVARAWAVAAGSGLVLGAFSVLGLTVFNHLTAPHHHRSLRDAVIDFVAAGLLAALAARSLVHRPTSGEQQTSRTAGRLSNAPTLWFLGAGALGMVVNFSTLVLFLPALHQIAHSSVTVADKAVAFVLIYFVTLVPVIVPVGLVTIFGDRARPALDAVHGFVTRHARQIGIVIEVVFAVYLAVKGVGELP
jgi:hypothetical protein